MTEFTFLGRSRKWIGIAAAVFWALALAMAMRQSNHPKVLGRYSIALFFVLVGTAGLASLLTLVFASARLHHWVLHHRSRIALSLAATIASLLVAECSLRVLKPLGLSYFDDLRSYQQDKVSDPTLVYRNPTSVVREYFGHTTRFNEIGLRGPSLQPKSGAFRILALGDSVTQGLAVAEPDTWVSRLATQCSSAGRTIETLNAGTGGYNTFQEERFLAQHMTEIDPDLLVLMFVENDVEATTDSFGAAERNPWSLGSLAERLWLYRLAYFSLMKRHGGLRTVRRDLHWSASLQALRSIARRCEEAHVPLVTFLWRWQPSPKTDALYEELAALAPEAGFLFCDVLPWFTGKDLSALQVSVIDSHPNVLGHEITAQGIASFMKDHKLLPP